MTRIAEIDQRLQEIRGLLESDKTDLDLDALETELRSLTDEKAALEKRKQSFDSYKGYRIDTGKDVPISRGSTFRELFFRNGVSADRDHGFRDFGEFLRCINSGRYDGRLEKRQMMGSVGRLGGFSVPEEMGGFIFDTSLEQEIVRPRATVWPVNTDTFRAPAWNGQDHSASLFGGLTGAWLAEAELANDEEAEMREILLNPQKLAVFVSVSNELLADSGMFEAQIRAAMGSTLSYQLDIAFLTGDGVGKPLGILNAPSIIEEQRSVANRITYADVCSMFARLHPALQQGAVWIVNNSLLPELLAMEDAGNHLVWHPDGTAGVPKTLLGSEVIFTEKVPALGNRGDITLVNLKQYVIGMRSAISLEKSNAPGWQRDLSSYRAIVRVDGQPAWHEPVTPVGGGDTLSWAVTLV